VAGVTSSDGFLVITVVIRFVYAEEIIKKRLSRSLFAARLAPYSIVFLPVSQSIL